jgi:hypothetical protein
LNDSTQLRAPLGLATYRPGLSIARITALALPDTATLVRWSVAVAVFVATLALSALNEHAPYNITPGVPGRWLAASGPMVAAAVAGYAVMRPWPAFAFVLLLTPWWNVSQVSWDVGPVQVILQTVFVVALGLGWLVAPRRARVIADGTRPASRPIGSLVARVATIALLAVAALSTLNSPNLDGSLTVLMHGIVEPVAMGVLTIALARTPRRLALILAALGISVAIGGLINMVQSIPAFGSLSALQAQRLLFSRLTYFNVGLFGEMLAMATPLLLGAIAARRQLRLDRRAVAFLSVCLAVSAASLFLTFSKSAWLATAGGTVVFFLLLAHTWRRRAAIALVSVALSALVVPWPAFVLQVSPPAAGAYRSVMVSLVGTSRFDSWNPSALSGRGSLVERLLATEAAVHMAADYPVLGIGLDRFKSEYVASYKTSAAHLSLDSAHTFWPEVAAELGVVALVFVVLIFAAALLALWRVYRAPPDDSIRLLAATLLASLVAWLLVATAFAGDMYRPWRNMSSDFVMMAVLTGGAFALVRIVAAGRVPVRVAAIHPAGD